MRGKIHSNKPDTRVIPKGPYCYDEKQCPYFEFRKLNSVDWNNYLNNYFVPDGNTKAQYCKLLKQYLSIPDMVKDCGINDDFEEDI